MTPTSAITPKLRTHRRSSLSQSHAARIIVRNPTSEPIKRCVCTNKIPPPHFETGNRNMLYPNVVGQSGTARPTFLLVTIPPLQIRSSAATQMNHAKRFSHLLQRSVTAVLAKLRKDTAPNDTSNDEQTTNAAVIRRRYSKETSRGASAMPQVQAVCFEVAARLARAK